MKFSKVIIVAALAIISTASFAQQKIGVITSQQIMFSMPEVDSMQVKLQAVEEGLIADMQAIQQEFVKKQQDYQKNLNTYSTTMREQKEKELVSLQTRYSEFEQVAQQEMQEQQKIMLKPIQEKFTAAVNKVAADNGFAMIFDKQAALFVSETLVEDITGLVVAELGITLKEIPTALMQ